ncbi:MAG TPA: hypothetical protein VK782_12860 [Candidatus Sulfotelmatobacter sp.]|nr:hypothetical protein [Candidatus Sulfotelmatobacter sp.]
MLMLASCNSGGSSSSSTTNPQSGIVHFDPNSHAFWSDQANWTTVFGPAYADITLTSTNFVPCRGGPYALCYYSGPSTGAEDLSCTLTADGNYANCQCFDIPYGVYFVDINAILNHDVYEKTVAQCGADGSQCATLNSAPVCANVNQGNLIPGSSVYSTFSFDCVPENGLGLTDCGAALYAGCMTAPCFKTNQAGIVNCSCPVFDGPYQVGQNDQACTLGGDLTWSAAYAPPAATPTATPLAADRSANAYKMMRADSNDDSEPAVPAAVPSAPACLPDAPGGFGCPLYVPGTTMLPPDSGVDCAKVCDEYHSCLQPKGAQAGFTCDATLCTDECNDRDLVSTACSGLSGCEISEIVKAKTAADCSCCASQLCQCDPSVKTNKAISALNQQQRDRGIKPQCDINGTLCGSN